MRDTRAVKPGTPRSRQCVRMRPQTQPHTNGETGMTLVEAMLATTATFVLIVAVLTAVTQQSRMRQSITESTLATQAILNNLERARSLDADAVAGLDGVGFDVPGITGTSAGLAAIPGDADGLPGQISVVVDRSGAPDQTLYRVAASVVWRGASGQRRLTLQTLIGERR